MSAARRAGVAYGLVVFAAGFLFGAIRVLLVVPRTGEFVAVALEIPVMLTVAWAVSARLVRSFAVGASSAERVAMGASAFTLLMLLEWALALLVFGRTAQEMLAGYGTPGGVLGLAGQAGVAIVPLLRAGGIESAGQCSA